MKLEQFQNTGFDFLLTFANGVTVTTNLKSLIGDYVSEHELPSAKVDIEWGCLEFCNGAVDIEPTTLYRYAINQSNSKQNTISGTTH
jgi:hypothetical protein